LALHDCLLCAFKLRVLFFEPVLSAVGLSKPSCAAAAAVWEVIMAAHPWKGMMMGEHGVTTCDVVKL
jgi:hypothetical protein